MLSFQFQHVSNNHSAFVRYVASDAWERRAEARLARPAVRVRGRVSSPNARRLNEHSQLGPTVAPEARGWSAPPAVPQGSSIAELTVRSRLRTCLRKGSATAPSPSAFWINWTCLDPGAVPASVPVRHSQLANIWRCEIVSIGGSDSLAHRMWNRSLDRMIDTHRTHLSCTIRPHNCCRCGRSNSQPYPDIWPSTVRGILPRAQGLQRH